MERPREGSLHEEGKSFKKMKYQDAAERLEKA